MSELVRTLLCCVKKHLLTRIIHHREHHIISHCVTYGYIAPLPLQHHNTTPQTPQAPPSPRLAISSVRRRHPNLGVTRPLRYYPLLHASDIYLLDYLGARERC